MALTMNLSKPGEKPSKLALNLKKAERFKVSLSWDGDHDLDLHALLCINTGAGAKASSFDDILSTYNVKRRLGTGEEVGTLPLNADKSFAIHNGALVHSPEALNGTAAGVDESIIIHPDKIAPVASGVIEIPLVAMIHPQSHGVKFRDVRNPTVSIENAAGARLFDANLSAQFGEFVGVQMGSVIIEPSGAVSFLPVAVGFNQDFNQVLGHFS
jgi:tellurium resistance protein TerD